MPDAMVPPDGGNPPAPPTPPGIPPPRRPASIECGFCDCSLLADGAVLKTSERARALQKAEDTIETLKARVLTLESELRELRKPAGPAGQKKDGFRVV